MLGGRKKGGRGREKLGGRKKGGREREKGDCQAHSENICDVIELSVQVHLNVPVPIIIAVAKLDDF